MLTKKSRITALALALLTASSGIACGSQSGSTDDTTAASAESTTPEVTTGEFDTGLEAKDFNDYTFNFAVRGKEGDPYQWNNTDILSEGENGDVLNDSIYRRNVFMKDTYNVNIGAIFCGNTSTSTSGSEMYSYISKSVMSGDNEFDAILSSPYDSIGYAMSDYVIDLKTVPNLDLTRKWWDQNAHRDLTFGSKIFITTGDITIIDNKATHVMLFNKDIADEYKIEDPYKAVREGKWTLDRFFADCAKVTTDLNGDSQMTKDDLWGYTYWQDGAFTFVYCTDNAFGKVNSKGEPELTLYTERMVNTWEKMIGFLTGGTAFSENEHQSEFPSGQTFNVMFGENHALYGWAVISNVINLRTFDLDFGILPNPKYDEEQEDYITSPHSYGNTMMTVPVTSKDLDRTGFILQAFAAKSAELVTPAFYDKTLVGKSTRDDQSGEMLDMIYANKRYDIGNFFMWGNYTNILMDAWNQKNPNFTSLYEGAESKALEDIAKISELFE